MDDVEEVIGEFLVESYENLEQLDQDLLALEKDPTERQTLARVFRTIHTIKGTCGFLGFDHLENLTHAGENLLSKLRDGALVLDSEMTTVLLAMVDAVRAMLAEIEASGHDGADEYSELIAGFNELLVEKPAEDAVAETTSQPVGEILVEIGAADQDEIELALAEQSLGSDQLLGEILVGHGAVDAENVDDALRLQGAGKDTFEQKSGGMSESTIRVDVSLLDRLMNLVGELVLARNNIVQRASGLSDPILQTASQRLDLVTGELQEGVMKTRMQAVGSVWAKFPRVVRDLSVMCGKQVRIEMAGEDTELDKTIIEAIKDPLTHIVRNAIDHGLESPAERIAAGKPAEGVLQLRARQEGGQVILEIVDDGAGIRVDKVKEKAIAKGLLTKEQARILPERDAMQLIFTPGFSTAAAVTNVSGRGVGMDVVRTNIVKIGGSVEITSTPGAGTTVSMRIPLTLAIVPALLVLCDDVRYAIPQVDVLELVRLSSHESEDGIEWLHNVAVYRLRGDLLPLVDLREELKLVPMTPKSPVTIAVVAAGERMVGICVDSVVSSEEIVVKPLGRLLAGNPAFSGATILGDGNVALILDVLGIAQRSGVIDSEDSHGNDGPAVTNQGRRDTTSLLVVNSGAERVAIPLADVARLEEISRDSIERSRGHDVVQHRGALLPIIALSELMGAGWGEPVDPLPIVVHGFRGTLVGIAVDGIVDIVETETALLDTHGAPVVISGRITEILDIQDALARHASWLTPGTELVNA